MKIIELAGTPKSGKDSINEELRNCLNRSNINILELKGGISKSPMDRKDSVEALIWSMCDLQINYMIERMHEGFYMIMNRGFFDRLIWIEQYLQLGYITEITAKKYVDCWLEFALDKANTTVFLLITSPDEAMRRDPRIANGTSNQSIMNDPFLTSFNESCLVAYEKYNGVFKNISIIDERLETLSLKNKIDIVLSNLP